MREFWLNMKKGKYTEFDMENNQIKEVWIQCVKYTTLKTI